MSLNLPFGATRALLIIGGGYANTPGAIAEKLRVGRTTVTGLLDRLEAEGMITRSIDPQDRRSFVLALTEAGLTLVQQIDEIRRDQLSQALDLMEPAALEALGTGLEALNQALQHNYKNSIKLVGTKGI